MDSQELEKKKKDWFSDIKYHIEQIQIQLNRMEREKNFVLKKETSDFYYQNDTTGEIEHHLERIKEVFKKAEEEESKKTASIEWADYKKVIGGKNNA